jgi:hypothetical protein
MTLKAKCNFIAWGGIPKLIWSLVRVFKMHSEVLVLKNIRNENNVFFMRFHQEIRVCDTWWQPQLVPFLFVSPMDHSEASFYFARFFGLEPFHSLGPYWRTCFGNVLLSNLLSRVTTIILLEPFILPLYQINMLFLPYKEWLMRDVPNFTRKLIKSFLIPL